MSNNHKNAYLARLEQEKQDRARIAQYVNERQSLDALILAVNEEFGFGVRRYIDTRVEVSELFVSDRYRNGDKDVTYAKAKVDDALRRIMGEGYPEHDVRYVVNIGKPLFDGGIVLGTEAVDHG